MNNEARQQIIIINLTELLNNQPKEKDSVSIDYLNEYCGYPYNYSANLKALEKAGKVTIDCDRISIN